MLGLVAGRDDPGHCGQPVDPNAACSWGHPGGRSDPGSPFDNQRAEEASVGAVEAENNAEIQDERAEAIAKEAEIRRATLENNRLAIIAELDSRLSQVPMKEINNIFEVAQSCSYADDSNAGCVEGNVDGLSTLLSMYFDLPDLNACLGGKGILHCLPAMVMIASHLHMKGVPSCNSFAGDTMVLMADGTSKPIDNVKVGDKIKNALPGAPPGTRDQTHTVTAIHVTHTDHNYTDITIATPNGTRTITGTSHHLYWDATSRAWTQADELHPGDHLQAADARTATILATRTYTATMVTYNLTVDGVHTYYVEAGATPVLVHNSLCGPVENSKPEELTMDMFEAELRGVVPVTASDAAKSGGDYLWAVGKDGSLNLVPALDGIFHTVATGGDSVVAAGQVTFRDGVVASFDNFTGHYTPCPQCAATFIERGVNAFASQGIRVPYSTIVDYGGRTP